MPKAKEPKPIPRTLFHGTLTKYVPSIREGGLRVGSVGVHPGFERDVEGCVFVAETEKDARFFGATTAIDRGEPSIDITVLIIDRLKAEIGGVTFFEPKGKLEGGRRGFKGRQFVACENIPPSAIVGYVRVYVDPVVGGVKEERGQFDTEMPRITAPKRREVRVRGHRRRA